MAANNATLLAFIASLVACVDINFSILTTTIISHFKTRFNLIRFNQIVESFCLRQRRLKRLQFDLNLVKNDYGFAQREQVPGGTTNRQAWLLCLIWPQQHSKFREITSRARFAYAYKLVHHGSVFVSDG